MNPVFRLVKVSGEIIVAKGEVIIPGRTSIQLPAIPIIGLVKKGTEPVRIYILHKFMEDQVINSDLSKLKAVMLLNEAKELGIQQGIIEKELLDLEHDIEKQAAYIAHLQQQNHY